jgi:phosphoglycolate phosphatase-like HAD superfamily hydrolase
LDIGCAEAIGAKSLAVATGSFSLDKLEAHKPTWAVASLSTVTARQICL